MEFFSRITKEGYVQILVDDNWVKEHRWVVEQFIGRELKHEETIHHLNELKWDNRIENLMIFPNNKEHTSFHRKIQQFGMTNPIKRQIAERWNKYKPDVGLAPTTFSLQGSCSTFELVQHTP